MSDGRLAKNPCPLIPFLRTLVSRLAYVKKDGLVDTGLNSIIMLIYTILFYAPLCYTMLFYAVVYAMVFLHSILYYAFLCYAMSRYAML